MILQLFLPFEDLTTIKTESGTPYIKDLIIQTQQSLLQGKIDQQIDRVRVFLVASKSSLEDPVQNQFCDLAHVREEVSIETSLSAIQKKYGSDFRYWFEILVEQPITIALIETLKFKVKITVVWQNSSLTLLFDNNLTIEDLISGLMNLLDLSFSERQNYIYELTLLSKEDLDYFLLERNRFLTSYKLSHEDVLHFRRRNRTKSENNDRPREKENKTSHQNFSCTILFPDVQFFQVLDLSPELSVRETLAGLKKRMLHPKMLARILQPSHFEDCTLTVRLPNGTEIWFDENKSIAFYSSIISENNYSVNLKRKPKSKSFAFLIPSTEFSVKIIFPDLSEMMPVMAIFSQAMLAKDLTAVLCSRLPPSAKEQQEAFGLYAPVLLGEGGEWLPSSKSLLSFNFEPQLLLEFKQDPKYLLLLEGAAKTFSTKLTPSSLISGENILFRNDRVLCVGNITGCLYLTNYRLIFLAHNRSSYDDARSEDTLSIPLSAIDTIEEFGSNFQCGMHIASKDWRNVTFGFTSETQRSTCVKKLKDLASFPDIRSVFAFTNREQDDFVFKTSFEVIGEFKRMGLQATLWRVTDVNKNYSVCPSYPSHFVVPANVSDQEIRAVAQYRSKGRVPAISWVHPRNGASLSRCSQPGSGMASLILGNRCQEDEKMVREIMNNTFGTKSLTFIDSRPFVNAMANTITGHGVENTKVYEGCTLSFIGIGNIYTMSEGYVKLKELCRFERGDNTKWLSGLESTKWLEYISQILGGAVRIARFIENDSTSVLTHCSDGWDRTSQLSALAQLMLDPFYRTIVGFQVLIEKEWISFGHKFEERCGHLTRSQRESPIFVMFIDAVWQICKQFPCSFQFNDIFLITILDHLYSCRFGTFLFDSEMLRYEADQQFFKQTGRHLPSLWAFIQKDFSKYVNSFYTFNPNVIFPVTDIRKLQVWGTYYMRWDRRMQDQETVDKKVKELESKQKELQHRLDELIKTSLF